jgi:IrrE N-terminal-like domain
MTAPGARPAPVTADRLAAPTAGPLESFASASGHNDPADAMDAAAAELLSRHGETVPPVGLRRLCRSFSADLRWASGARAHGRLDVADGRFVITVSKNQGWRRQRFSLAHEIGHLVMFNALQDDGDALRSLVAPEHWAGVERLCDRAASRLLVPPSMLRDDLLAAPLGPDRLRALYDRYMVSWPVLLRAVAEATSSSVSLWSRQRRHENERYAPRLTAAYAWDGGPFLPRGMTSKHVTPDLVGRCYAGGTARGVHVAIDVRGSDVVAGPGVALPWSPPAAAPSFQGMPVPDEPTRPWDVVLLVGPAAEGEPRK